MGVSDFAVPPGLSHRERVQHALRGVPSHERGFNCPRCGWLPECHPTEKVLLVRGYKVSDDAGDWSQCLICSGLVSPDLVVRGRECHDGEKGWFCG